MFLTVIPTEIQQQYTYFFTKTMQLTSAYFPVSKITTALDQHAAARLDTSHQLHFATSGNNFPTIISALWHRQPTGFGTLLHVADNVTLLMFTPNVASILQAVSAPHGKDEITVQAVSFDQLSALQRDSVGNPFLATPSFVLVANANFSSRLSLTIPVHYSPESLLATISRRCSIIFFKVSHN